MTETGFRPAGPTSLPAASLAIIALAAAVLTGCNSSGTDATTGPLPAPRTATTLSSDLTIGSGDILFSQVASIAVDDAGSIYVADVGSQSSVQMFDAEGNHIGQLGGLGEGPGEYRRPGRIIADPDSIVVFDSYFNRRLVFDRDGTPRRTLPRFEASEERTSLGIIDRVGDGSGYFGYQSQYFIPGMTDEDFRDHTVHFVDLAGSVGPTLTMARRNEVLYNSAPNRISVRTAPFGRQTYFAVVGDSLYSAWSASVKLEGITVDGDSLEPIEIAYQPIRITEAEKNEESESASDEFKSKLVFPDTRPAIEGMVSDDRGQIWIKVRTAPDDEITTYWIVNPQRRTVRAVTLDGNVLLMTVQGGNAYGVFMTEEGEPLVIRFRVG